jgi:S-adenosylmethionine synthetase
MVNIQIQHDTGPTPADLQVEIVERKGLGHPDSICDAIMDDVALALSRTYLEQAGTVLHYNCDKAMLVAGQAELAWGGGRILEPMRLVMGDRATAAWDHHRIDVAEIAIGAARGWFRRHLRHVDPDTHVRYQVEIKPGSAELTGLFRRGASPAANDTSAVVGYAPLTETERLVLDAEHFLNGTTFKAAFPETGEDVKVMAVREGQALHLTVAMPLIDRMLRDEENYFERVAEIRHALLAYLEPKLVTLHSLSITMNALDRRGAGIEGIYASVLGVSAESADSGEVGRGNGVNGLISLCRPGGAEAAAGKNPVSHVGKIYNVLADRLAARLVAHVAGLQAVTIWLSSEIGQPVDQPRVVYARAHLAEGAALPDLIGAVHTTIGAALEELPTFCRELAVGAGIPAGFPQPPMTSRRS